MRSITLNDEQAFWIIRGLSRLIPDTPNPHLTMVFAEGHNATAAQLEDLRSMIEHPPQTSTLGVVVEGGMISDIISENPADHGRKVVVIDYDVDSSDQAETSWVQQGKGSWVAAHVSEWVVDPAAIGLDDIRAEEPADA